MTPFGDAGLHPLLGALAPENGRNVKPRKDTEANHSQEAHSIGRPGQGPSTIQAGTTDQCPGPRHLAAGRRAGGTQRLDEGAAGILGIEGLTQTDLRA